MVCYLLFTYQNEFRKRNELENLLISVEFLSTESSRRDSPSLIFRLHHFPSWFNQSNRSHQPAVASVNAQMVRISPYNNAADNRAGKVPTARNIGATLAKKQPSNCPPPFHAQAIDQLGPDAISVKIAQTIFNSSEVVQKLAYIQSNFSFIPTAIKKLETQGLSLNQSFETLDAVKTIVEAAPGEIGQRVKESSIL
uniref:Uncharacterized protein n=1 Tax=Ditylenchus dipsaci TaxID=166011 RepID=A0A915D4N7_9BILA